MHLVWIVLICFSGIINGFVFPTPWPTMEPNQDKDVAVNDTVVISCMIASSEEVSLLLNNTLVKKTENASYIEYKLTSHKPEVYIFTCKHLKATNKVKITFRYAPQVISARVLITSFCHMVVNFTVAHFTKFDYIKISRYLDVNKTFQVCSNTNVCEFDCKLLNTYILKVQISATDLPEYSANWTFHAYLTYYKLDKLKLLTISAKSESLSLTYGITNNYDKIFTTTSLSLYRVLYKSEWDQTPKNFITNRKDIILENLVPYTTYTIEMQAKLDKSIYWSDKLTHKERTLPSAPYAGPHSTNGSYLETTCADKSKRCFILYWAMIPMPLRNGILDGYVIQQDSRILFQTSEIFAQISDQPQNKELWFEIRAKNNDSQYSPPTIIYIPPKAPERPKGVSVVRLNSTHFSISWSLKQSLKNVTVTVMSCLGEKAVSTLWCKSDVMWTRIKNKNFTILKAVNATHFAAYVSNSEGSSSLTSAECILSGGISKRPPKPIIGNKYPYQINLLWPSFGCSELNGRPTLFQILYAEGNSCGNGLAMNISASGIKPETENIEIKDLKPFTIYSMCLRIRTEQGWSQKSPQVKTSTSETNPNGSVRNLQVANISANSVTLRWDPTLQPNGIIRNHMVNYAKLGGMTRKLYSNASNMATVSHLHPYSKYNFTVSTCNNVGCSEKSPYVTASTLIGNTAVVDLQLILMTKSKLGINWNPPAFLRKHLQYYKVEVIYDKNEFIYNVTEEEYNISIPCHSDNNVLVTVNVEAVIKNGSYLIYGDTVKESQYMCSKSEENWVLIMLFSFLFGFTFLICCGCCLRSMFKKYKNLDVDIIIPDVPKDTSSDDIHIQDGYFSHGYITIDPESQTKLIDSKSGDFSSTEERDINLDNDNTNNNSREALEMVHVNASELSTIHKNEHNLQRKLPSSTFSQANLDTNGYICNINLSELNQGKSDSNHHGNNHIALSELSLANLDSNVNKHEMKSSELSQANSDSNHYGHKHITSSDLSQANLNSNGYVHDEMKSSELSQVNSDSNNHGDGYIASSELSHASLDSNGYIQNNMNSSELSQANSDSDAYVQNNMNSSELSQANSDSDAYVQNNMNSSELSQANSDSDAYVQNNMNSSELSQANSDSDAYVQNNMNSSELSQANSDSNAYVQNNMNTSELSQANSDSNNHGDDRIASSELSQVRLDSNGYIQNNMNSSELSQGKSDFNHHGNNHIALSELSQGILDSNVNKHEMNSSELSQVNSDSNNHGNDRIASSELSQVRLDSNGYVYNTNSNSHGDNHIASKFSQVNSDSNADMHKEMNPARSLNSNSDLSIQNIQISSKSPCCWCKEIHDGHSCFKILDKTTDEMQSIKETVIC